MQSTFPPITLTLLVASVALPALAVEELPDGFSVQTLAELSNPVGFAFLPDGRALIVEQKQEAPHETEGYVYLYANGSVTGSPILVIPDVNAVGNERGLLGVAVDPGWPDRPYAYFFYDHLDGTNRVRMYAAVGDLTDPYGTALTFSSPYDVLTDLPDFLEWHNGGTLRFGPDGMLYVSHGDDATDQCDDFQDPSRWHGVILRLDVSALPGAGSGPPDKSIITPADNPFAGPDAFARLTFAIGFRNPFRFNVDPLTGALYVGDVGEAAYEELDECIGGENFGWPEREGAHDYVPGQPCLKDPGVDPIAEIAHDGVNPFSIISGPRYRPRGGVFDLDAEYDGDVFYLEFYSGVIRRLTDDGGAWVPAPPVPGQPGPLDWARGIDWITDLQVGPDGALYYTRLRSPASFGRIVGPPVVGVPEAPASGLDVHVGPHPIAPGDAIVLSLTAPGAAVLELALFDVVGHRLDGTRRESATGRFSLEWTPRGGRAGLSPGIYFLRVDASGRRAIRRLVVAP